MPEKKKIPPSSDLPHNFFPSLNLNDAHATYTVLLQSAQFENENEKDDYRHKFTDGRKRKKKNQKKNQSKEGKSIFLRK